MSFDFVAISFETANEEAASACAVGLVRIRDGVMVDRYSTFINYPRSLGSFDTYSTELHGITPKDLIGAPVWRDVLPTIIEFIADDYVVAHNSGFDMDVLTAASEDAGVTLPDLSHFCTRQLAKKAIPNLPKHRLPDVVRALNIGNYTTHDTEGNALFAAKVCIALADREELSSLTHIMSKYGVREIKMGLGRGYFVPAEKAAVEAVQTPVAPAPVEAPVVAAAEPVAVPVVQEVKPAVMEVKVVEPKKDVPSSAIASAKGQRISFVGGFDLADRTAAKEKITEQGGKYLKNVRPDTTLLVIGTHHNPNLEGIVVAKAFNEQGSKIAFMSKDEFFSVLGL